ncbi:hypothetical protein BKA82DRAFT_996629 [Pisolithus tinctorius]|uniref:FAD dependent oxidoreductase domain-containing protein n=1 Tax=Pisolithus tinctorius Marx 270 TaxID=870435 RepID=A0A0C3KJL2_PISTI|nr:hypothetical protein BKA82DRAFT_996629 [Pisolithus tinctorius]KIO09762.1 hypothetical protein M404DRAFT_996629 [Pisolithus tinctorius Marx 270]
MHRESKATKDVVVIGAGVVGLSTAIRIQEEGGYRATVVAETFPTDPKTIRYASHWAGAHHVSAAFDDKRQREMDKGTFEIMWKDSAHGGPIQGCFLRHNHTEFRSDGVDPTEWLDYMPEFRSVSNNELVPGATRGWTFTTFTLYPPVYLNWLLGRFLTNGGTIVRAQLQHISQAMHGGISGLPQRPDAIVACVGLGARFLGGIEDKEVYPVRGQSIVLKAPWVKYSRTLSCADGSYFYMMPRVTGDVLVGGIKSANDWFPIPRKEGRDYILAGVLAICPELAPPKIRAERVPTIDDLRPLIVEEGCALPPSRNGGIRLETEWFKASPQSKIPVVYNYGHAGMGFQSSWGSASIALDLLEEALASGEPNTSKGTKQGACP